jgi:hypothetical protein
MSDDTVTKTFYIAGKIDGNELLSVDLVEEYVCPFEEDVIVCNGQTTEAEMLAEWKRRKTHFKYSPGHTDLIEITVTARVIKNLSQ